jgi:hypothetical protein
MKKCQIFKKGKPDPETSLIFISPRFNNGLWWAGGEIEFFFYPYPTLD